MSADEKPGLLERYSIACSSNHLEIHPHKRGAVDLLTDIAFCSGKSNEREPLGAMLMRLVHEFDQARGEYASARRHQAACLARSKAVKDVELAAEMLHEAEVNALSAHMHILQKLPSLPTTREAFGNWTILQAEKHNFMPCGLIPRDVKMIGAWREDLKRRYEVIAILAGRVLDVFLEPTCLRCSGRGFSGGYNGKVQTICNNRAGCGGSGKRSIDNIGNTKEQHDFSQFLYGQAERLLRNVEIRYYANQREDRTPA